MGAKRTRKACTAIIHDGFERGFMRGDAATEEKMRERRDGPARMEEPGRGFFRGLIFAKFGL